MWEKYTEDFFTGSWVSRDGADAGSVDGDRIATTNTAGGNDSRINADAGQGPAGERHVNAVTQYGIPKNAWVLG